MAQGERCELGLGMSGVVLALSCWPAGEMEVAAVSLPTPRDIATAPYKWKRKILIKVHIIEQ